MSLTVNTFDNSFDSSKDVSSFDMDEISLNSNNNTRKVSVHSNENAQNNNDSHISPAHHKINAKLIHAISRTLIRVLKENQRLQCYPLIIKEQVFSVFSARAAPAITVDDYLYRTQYYGEMEDNTLIIALIFIDRLCNIASITLTQYNIHRILFAAILTAVKYNEDKIYDNVYYAEIAGVPLKELNIMESEFLGLINFNLCISTEVFEHYHTYLVGLVGKSVPISSLSLKNTTSIQVSHG